MLTLSPFRLPLRIPENGKLLNVLRALLTAILCISPTQKCALAQADAPPVIVDRVIEKQVKSGYRVVGEVTPLRTTTIGVAVGGRVEEFLVNVGQRVKSDQPLAKLRTGTLKIELSAAQAELDLYQQQLAEVQNGSRPEDVAEAKANASGSMAAMENAAAQMRRLQLLSTSGAATESDLENARERANLTKFAHSAAAATLKRIEEGPRIEQIAQREAQVELQKQRILLIQDRISQHTIRAPFDGFVSAEFTEIGAWINSGDPVAQIIQLDEVEVQAPITANYAAKMNLGDTIRVEFPEIPDMLLTGTIDRIVPLAQSRARTYPVYVRLRNKFRGEVPLLMAGMLARVDLPAGAEKVLPLVPKDALVLNEGRRSVFVVDVDENNPTIGKVRKIDVELGIALDDLIQVDGALIAGQIVVVVGNERLSSGDQVTLITKNDPDDLEAQQNGS